MKTRCSTTDRLAEGESVTQPTPSKQLEKLAREWVDSHFPDFDDRDIYIECFIAGYRAARPKRKVKR